MIGRVADLLTIVVGVALLVVLALRMDTAELPPPTPIGGVASGGPVIPPPDVNLDAAEVGIDWTAGVRTLLLVLQSDCEFCQQSVPFYRRLLDQDTDEIQNAVVAPARDVEMSPYLLSEGIIPDTLAFVENGVVPVPVTPTLLLVDSTGSVIHAWIGVLEPEQEAEVLAVTFAPA